MSEGLGGFIAAYTEAMERFSESAKAFLQHVDLLNEARIEYKKAAVASRALRNILNTGDEALRTLMTQLETAISNSVGEPVLSEKDTEPMREPVEVEAMKAGATGASTGVVKTFP